MFTEDSKNEDSNLFCCRLTHSLQLLYFIYYVYFDNVALKKRRHNVKKNEEMLFLKVHTFLMKKIQHLYVII